MMNAYLHGQSSSSHPMSSTGVVGRRDIPGTSVQELDDNMAAMTDSRILQEARANTHPCDQSFMNMIDRLMGGQTTSVAGVNGMPDILIGALRS